MQTWTDDTATAIPVTPESMNYASVVFIGFAFIAIAWYAIYARKHYKGPVQSAVGAREGSPLPGGEVVEPVSVSPHAKDL